jgi:hypothetical protein
MRASTIMAAFPNVAEVCRVRRRTAMPCSRRAWTLIQFD